MAKKNKKEATSDEFKRNTLARPPIHELQPGSQYKTLELEVKKVRQMENDDHLTDDEKIEAENNVPETSSSESEGGNSNDEHQDQIRKATPDLEAKRKRKPKSSAKQMPEQSSKTSKHLILGSGLMLLLACCYYYWFNTYDSGNQVLDISEKLKILELEFKGQPPMSYRVVMSALKSIAEPNPKAPAIIMLLHTKGAKEIAYGLSRKIAGVIVPERNVTIRGIELRNIKPGNAKKDIDDRIKDTLNPHERGAVFVYDLDLVPAEAAIMFHTYCDHENAPYKRVVYVMTVTSEETIPKDSKPKYWDTKVNAHLNNVWHAAGEDTISSLLSRLTVGVVAVTERQ